MINKYYILKRYRHGMASIDTDSYTRVTGGVRIEHEVWPQLTVAEDVS